MLKYMAIVDFLW